MIKQTYYNLPADKRDRIMKAVVKETESKAYDKISINKIVKDAGISRGSFYQYFDDKWDLLILMLKDFYIKLSRECINALESNGGDIFAASESVFRFVIGEYYSEKYGSALKTIFLHSNVNTIEFLKRKRDNDCEKSLLEEIKELINRDMYHIECETSIEYIITILTSLMMRLWFEAFVLDKDKDEICEELRHMFLMIRNGFSRR